VFVSFNDVSYCLDNVQVLHFFLFFEKCERYFVYHFYLNFKEKCSTLQISKCLKDSQRLSKSQMIDNDI